MANTAGNEYDDDNDDKLTYYEDNDNGSKYADNEYDDYKYTNNEDDDNDEKYADNADDDLKYTDKEDDKDDKKTNNEDDDDNEDDRKQGNDDELCSLWRYERILKSGPPKQADKPALGRPRLATATSEIRSSKTKNKKKVKLQ